MLKQPDRIVLFLCFSLLAAPLAGQSDPPKTAGRIVGAALVESRAWSKLAWLSDRIGHRFTGSPGLERAIDWAVAEFERDGMDRVWTDEVQVPRWIRGEAERAHRRVPTEHPIERCSRWAEASPTAAEGLSCERLSSSAASMNSPNWARNEYEARSCSITARSNRGSVRNRATAPR